MDPRSQWALGSYSPDTLSPPSGAGDDDGSPSYDPSRFRVVLDNRTNDAGADKHIDRADCTTSYDTENDDGGGGSTPDHVCESTYDRRRRWWASRHEVSPCIARDSNMGFMLEAAVPMRLYVRGPSPEAVAAAALLHRPALASGSAGAVAREDQEQDQWDGDLMDQADEGDDIGEGCATALGIDPNLLHAPSAMIDNEAYVRGRSAYVAVQHEALQAHRERGVRLLSEVAASTGLPMDLSSVLDLYKGRLAVAHLQSLRRRVVALDALYDHATRGGCSLPEAVRVAATTASGVELAAAWYARWAATATPLQTPDDADFGDGDLPVRHPHHVGSEAPSRPVAWVPVAGNTGVPLAAGAPLFYVGRMPDPLACPVHRDAHGHLTCPPIGCIHRGLLARVMDALGDARALDALLTDLVVADADTTEFALALRSTVNATLDRARRRWGGETPAAIQREPVDLFSECPVDAFVLVRMGADGTLLPHVIAVAPRFDIELCL